MCYGYGFMGWGWVFGICILIIVILGFVFLYRPLWQSHQHDSKVASQNALDILNSRYAKGEISDEEYNMKKAQLIK